MDILTGRMTTIDKTGKVVSQICTMSIPVMITEVVVSGLLLRNTHILS